MIGQQFSYNVLKWITIISGKMHVPHQKEIEFNSFNILESTNKMVNHFQHDIGIKKLKRGFKNIIDMKPCIPDTIVQIRPTELQTHHWLPPFHLRVEIISALRFICFP